MRACPGWAPRSVRSFPTAPLRTSIRAAAGVCRSTTRPTCGTPSRGSARSPSRTRVPGTERSTELLGRLDQRYAPLLTEIRRLVRAAVRRAGGREVDARADEFFAVFEHAPAAVEGALAIQRAMYAGPWPDESDVRLRIGVHRGRPTLTDTGYVGLAVHAAARICFAAHGGQIVVSSAARAAITESLGEGIGMRSLGAWRFQGLPEPVDLFQAEAPDLFADFPPLRSAVP